MSQPDPFPPFDDIGVPVPVDIPAGFRRISLGGGFMAHNGPLYARWTGEQVLAPNNFVHAISSLTVDLGT